MLQVYVGSARDLSQKNRMQNSISLAVFALYYVFGVFGGSVPEFGTRAQFKIRTL